MFIKSTRLNGIASIVVLSFFLMSGCGSDDSEPQTEGNPVEIITNVILNFTPIGGGETVMVEAENLNSNGFQDFRATQAIDLKANTSYTLTVDFTNSQDPNNLIDVKSEVLDEATEHKLMYIWLGDLFNDPPGNGNADNPADIINYNDFDGNGLPLGLSTRWTTGDATAPGDEFLFRVLLMHQPILNGSPMKSATSGINNGGRDFNIAWRMNVN